MAFARNRKEQETELLGMNFFRLEVKKIFPKLHCSDGYITPNTLKTTDVYFLNKKYYDVIFISIKVLTWFCGARER